MKNRYHVQKVHLLVDLDRQYHLMNNKKKFFHKKKINNNQLYMNEKMNQELFVVDIHLQKNYMEMNENLYYCIINKDFEDEVQI